ncbi:MAG: hypothetical protein EOP36_01730 [Rubrivivax sp.]|nr:MAG: hypothetical protein EOP36_01730 [Rubrivivax sp.]
MRAGADRVLNVVVNTVGQARAHHGYLFANARATRIKLLVHDGFGVWCATRRLHAGRFVWLERDSTVGSAGPALQLPAALDGPRALQRGIAQASGRPDGSAVLRRASPALLARVRLRIRRRP